jgi:pSer/pThr/pTyr-binding forkhead associated (FHA) protein
VGGVQMFYDQIPEYLMGMSGRNPTRHVLTVTPTGRKVNIMPPDDIFIGRSDRYVDFAPDVDLNQDGQPASRVSRRHAIIHWRNDHPYLEDLGSGFGTRVNGKLMLLGQAALLKPGDHIWLGGCVLAYDVEM